MTQTAIKAFDEIEIMFVAPSSRAIIIFILWMQIKSKGQV